VLMNIQSPEQRFLSGEQRSDRVQQQALAKPPGPREEPVIALRDQVPNQRGLVYVIAVCAS